MRVRYISSVLGVAAFAMLCLTSERAEARGRQSQYRTAYVQVCRPVYYSMPTAYYAPRNYSQRIYTYPPMYAPRLSPARPTTVVTVAAYDNYFEPKTINVQPGTTVHWLNKGKHPHTVTAKDDRWDSGDIAPGGSYTATFQQPGAYYYYCRHHTDDKMQGTIIVGSAAGRSDGQAYGDQRSRGTPRGSGSSGY